MKKYTINTFTKKILFDYIGRKRIVASFCREIAQQKIPKLNFFFRTASDSQITNTTHTSSK